MTEQRLSAVVLAAGEGSRMRSTRPKPLHLLCGRAMVLYVLDALPRDQVDRAVVVVGHHAERVTKKLTEDGAGLQLEFRSEEHTSELQSLMRISYAVFCLKKTKTHLLT